ncbi:MAG: ABC transporter substrate-binding protein [Chloroflexi bacterium]|nr:ABC transporter substrate-binding protein [Chloroflexota bacterium]
MADGLGFFERQGLKIEEVTFNAASAVAPALASNQVDVADVGVNPAMFNTMAAALGAKVVADKGSTPSGFGFTSIVVRKDLADKVKGPADLKGLNLAMTPPGLGTANGYALDKWITPAKLTVNDFHVQPLAFPDQVAALSNKAVDAAFMAEPYATQAVNQGFGVRLVTTDKMAPDQQIAGIAFSAGFLQRKDVAQKYMVAYLQGIRAYDDAFKKGVNKDKVIQIMADKTPVKDVQLWSQMIPAGLNPDGTLNVQSIQDQEDFFKRLNLVPANAPAPASFIDDSFAKQAAQTLGAYS